MFLNKKDKQNPIIKTPFATATEGFRYLSVKITPEVSDMVGRINLIKMTILPQFLYYFQTPPLPLPKMCEKINRLLGQFIWNDRKARLRLKLLYWPYERALRQLPNLRWYYIAAQLTSALYYFNTTTPPVWVSIEQESIPDLPLSLYLYSSDIKILTRRTKNPFLKNTISVWYAADKHIG